MMPESLTQEAVLEKVRKRVGTLDAKAEHAVTQAIAVLSEFRKGETATTVDEKFVSANVSLAQYDAWSPEERFQYLNNAKRINAGWLEKRFRELRAAWLMVIDGSVISHGSSIQQLPSEEEFDALCEKRVKYPFVFFNPRQFLIEESSAFVVVNPARMALVGRSLFFKLAAVVHLNFDARQTDVEFSFATSR